MDCGEKCEGFPSIHWVIRKPKWFKHLPKQPKKVMMQLWQHKCTGTIRAYRVTDPPYNWSKVGEPFEFTYPEESE